MKTKLAKLLKRLSELALKEDLSEEEANELREGLQEKENLELQIATQEQLEEDRKTAEAAEADALAATRQAEIDAALADEKEKREALETEVAELKAAAGRNPDRSLAPVTGSEDQPVSIKISSPYDRLDVMDLAVRYELLKSWGKQPSLAMWRALAERAVKISREEDVLYVKNGQAVKAPALDWEYMVPRNLDLRETEDGELFGVKAGAMRDMDPRKMAEDVVTPRGLRQLHAITTKANELIYSTQTSYGDEWVPTLMNAALWRTIRLNAAVLPLFDQFDMPSQPYEYPIESTDPTFYKVGEATNEAHLVLTGGPFYDSKVGTGKVTFTAGKLGALSYWSEEMEEDAIIATEPQLRDQYGLAFAHNIDYVLINGDETTGALTNINKEGTNPGGSERYLVIDGLRHQPMITTTADKRDAGTLTIDDFGATQALMGTAGKWGVNPADLVFLMDTGVWHKAKLLGEVLTLDKFGPMATVRTGQLAALFGSALLISEDYPLTDATGHIDGTAADNVKGSFLCVNKRGVLIGWRRRPRVRVFGIPGAESRAIIGSARFDMQFKEAGMVALSYNVTV